MTPEVLADALLGREAGSPSSQSLMTLLGLLRHAQCLNIELNIIKIKHFSKVHVKNNQVGDEKIALFFNRSTFFLQFMHLNLQELKNVHENDYSNKRKS